MIKAIALDDEPLSLEILQEYCSKVDGISLERTFTKVNDAKKYLQNFPIDLLFLDIHMPQLSGIQFYNDLGKDKMVIFTSAYSQYAIDSYNLNAIDYLLKPFSPERFLTAATKANDFYNFLFQKNSSPLQYLFVRSDYSLHQIPFSEILFIESLSDYLNIHQQNQKRITVRMTMKAMLEKLPSNDFIRVHRSFIIPFKRVEQVRNKVITISEKQIPIGSTYEDDFYSRMKA